MKTIPVRLCWIPLVLILIGISTLHAQERPAPYDPFIQPGIMHVGYLNADCVPDTVYGYMSPQLQWIPRYICWGHLYDSAGAPLCASGKYDASIKRANRYDTTTITSPEWGRYSCALSVDRYNTNDTLDDLIFWIKGIDTITSRGDVILHDTARALVIFGQSGLETRREIDLAAIKDFQSGPYTAMALGFERELINPKRRDHTRKISWELKKVDQAISREEDDSTKAPAPALAAVAQSSDKETTTARIWPNPTLHTTTLEIKPLPPGVYRVAVISVSGEQHGTAEIEVYEDRTLFETVDLSDLPSGHYIVRVTTGTSEVGVYPVIVVR